MVERLQVKACNIGKILTSLEKKYSNNHEKDGMTKSPSGQTFGFNPQYKRHSVRIQRIPPFDANKVRKSPSTDIGAAAQATPTTDEPVFMVEPTVVDDSIVLDDSIVVVEPSGVDDSIVIVDSIDIDESSIKDAVKDEIATKDESTVKDDSTVKDESTVVDESTVKEAPKDDPIEIESIQLTEKESVQSQEKKEDE